MYLTKTEAKNLEVKKSRNGKGIFAKRKFKTGDTIFQVVGRFITGDVDEALDDTERDNAFRYDKDRYISPKGRIGDYLNHSCEPNARVVKKNKKLFIVAAQPIVRGEEVLIDYSTIIASDDIWSMRCNCGSKQCRGIVRQFHKLSKNTKENYLQSGMVPKYILTRYTI